MRKGIGFLCIHAFLPQEMPKAKMQVCGHNKGGPMDGGLL